MNGGNKGKKQPIITVGGGGGRTISAGNGGAIVKVSSSTPVIKGPNGAVTLVVSAASGSIPSPNVSVTPGSSSLTPASAKRLAPRVNVTTASTSSSSGSTRKRKDSGKKGHSSSSSKPEAKKPEKINIRGDLKNIMQAFGNEYTPLDESVQLMEVIIKQELQAFIFICDTAASLSGSKSLGLRECIYAMRNDKKYLSRLFKYLELKDQKQKQSRHHNHKGSSHHKPYMREIRGILNNLDDTGELGKLLDTEYSIESSKTERTLKADRINQRLSNPKYYSYAKARSVSFARKLLHLKEWIEKYLHSEFKLSSNFIDVMGFLTYEMVAQIVDLSFIIKRERTGGLNPIQRLCDTRGANPDTCMSAPAFLKKRKDDECNNVSEILVQASELEAKRLKNVHLPNKEILVKNAFHSLQPSEIREAYIRMLRSPPPSISYAGRADKLRQLNIQY